MVKCQYYNCTSNETKKYELDNDIVILCKEHWYETKVRLAFIGYSGQMIISDLNEGMNILKRTI